MTEAGVGGGVSVEVNNQYCLHVKLIWSVLFFFVISCEFLEIWLVNSKLLWVIMHYINISSLKKAE